MIVETPPKTMAEEMVVSIEAAEVNIIKGDLIIMTIDIITILKGITIMMAIKMRIKEGIIEGKCMLMMRSSIEMFNSSSNSNSSGSISSRNKLMVGDNSGNLEEIDQPQEKMKRCIHNGID